MAWKHLLVIFSVLSVRSVQGKGCIYLTEKQQQYVELVMEVSFIQMLISAEEIFVPALLKRGNGS